MKRNTIFGLLICWSSLLISACGGSKSILKSITVKTDTDSSQNAWVQMDATLNMGGLKFPALSLPIASPNDPRVILGQIQLQTTLDGNNIISADVNVTEIAKYRLGQDSRLPNGGQIPVGGLNGVVAARFGGNSKVYIGSTDKQIVMGVAIAIKEFDSISRYLPGANLFLPFSAKQKVNGLAGVFTGSQSGTSGIGIFFEVPNTVTSTSSAKFLATGENSSEGIALQGQLYQLSRKSKVVNIK
ncbi:MAG: hypothetical protein A2Z20_11745 [Bdellovibrionales bacterium RBG_16_40_8]|nr:MAG: hypothetical protein A2Z20_11745 [Bdellovibrionales bacterium RBG_16_40_8]